MAGTLSRRRGRARALRAWGLRITVATALGLSLTFAGPRALAVTRARLAAAGATPPGGPRVDLDRVAIAAAPAWLRGDLLVHVSADLAVALRGEVGLHDEAAALRLLAELRASPWVREAELQRVYPDRLRAALRLREPIAALGEEGSGCALDADAVCLPWTRGLRLPVILAGSVPPGAPGTQHADAAVRDAVAVAVEWAADIAPQVPGAPPLLFVDATNRGYARIAEQRWCEIRVGLARAGGGVAWLDYDHAPGSAAPRVPSATKVGVLQRLLAAHPGLSGVAQADLRFSRRWQSWVRLEPAVEGPAGGGPGRR